jgi:hypothetical protein
MAAGEQAVLAYGREKRFSAATMRRWLSRSTGEQRQLLDLAAQLRLGENQFRDFLDLLQDIAARRGVSIAALLEGPEVQAVWAQGRGRNEAIKALRATLRRIRYPHLVAAERRVAELVRRLKLPAGVDLQAPLNLEGNEVTIHLRGKSASEIRSRAAALAVALELAEVDEVYRILEGGE